MKIEKGGTKHVGCSGYLVVEDERWLKKLRSRPPGRGTWARMFGQRTSGGSSARHGSVGALLRGRNYDRGARGHLAGFTRVCNRYELHGNRDHPSIHNQVERPACCAGVIYNGSYELYSRYAAVAADRRCRLTGDPIDFQSTIVHDRLLTTHCGPSISHQPVSDLRRSGLTLPPPVIPFITRKSGAHEVT